MGVLFSNPVRDMFDYHVDQIIKGEKYVLTFDAADFLEAVGWNACSKLLSNMVRQKGTSVHLSEIISAYRNKIADSQ